MQGKQMNKINTRFTNMMKKLLYCMSVMLATLLLVGCTPDDGPKIGPGNPGEQTAHEVEIHLGVVSNAGSSSRSGNGRITGTFSRANSDYSDTNAQTGEWMKNWLVVIVDSNHQIIDIKKNGTYDNGETERSQDTFWERMSPGTYTFYSFANISSSELGIDAYKKGGILPADFFEQKKYSVKIPSLVFADHWSDFETDYFKNGIPMSNKQEITIGENDKSIDLEVIRMLAKVQLQLTNNTDHSITFKGLKLSDVTPNDEPDNLMLLPGADEKDSLGITHVSAPKLGTTKKLVQAYTQKPEGAGHDYVIQGNNASTTNICFYVNESEATAENKYLVLQLQTQDNDNTATQVNRRLAMLDWRKICRNDYRIIPIKLEDYAIEWEVEAFTPIGVLPEVEDDGDNLTVTMGYYGEFHIVPKVRQLSTNQFTTVHAGSFTYVEGLKDIFDTEPQWNQYSRKVEGEMANIAGTSIYALTLKVYNDAYHDKEITLTRKVRFVMNPVNLSSRSASGNKFPACQWQKVEFNP